MSILNNEVVQKITVKDPQGDGFKKLAQQAKTAEAAVNRTKTAIDRVGASTKQLGAQLRSGGFTSAGGGGFIDAGGGSFLGGSTKSGLGRGAMMLGHVAAPYVGDAVGKAGGSRLGGAASGAMQGAMIGGTIGSIVPGIGTGIGAGAGAVIGGVAGFLSSDDEDPYTKLAQVRNPILGQKRALSNLREQLSLSGKMGDKPGAELAQASLAREQAVRRVLEIEKELAKTGTGEAAKRLDLTNQLAEATQNIVRSEVQKLEAMKAQMQLIKAERERLDQMKSSFGLMDVMKQSAAVDIARKMKAGEDLDADELEIARSTELLRDPLQKFGKQKAEQSGLADFLVGFTGQDMKLKQAESDYAKAANIKLDLSQKVEASIKIDEQSLARHIEREVTPAITKAMQALNRQMVEQISKLDLQRSFHTGVAGGP